MKLLIPLGLLGLLSIIVLIVIYIIRPNYQQKTVSSTYVWKLSLKYRKKRIPTSKIRNLLIVLCQILILSCCAMILAQPNLVNKNYNINDNEIIVIIDSSASMRTESSGITRFERAVSEARVKIENAMSEGGCASVILADDSPDYLFERLSASERGKAVGALNKISEGETYCSYGNSDTDEAIALCESVLSQNPAAEIFYYTDVAYGYVPEGVHLVNMCESSEWNAAILNASTELIDNFYAITVQVACYNRDYDLPVTVNVNGANAGGSGDGVDLTFTVSVRCFNDEPKTVMFVNENTLAEDVLPSDMVFYPLSGSNRIYSYKSIFIYISEADSLSCDNAFNIYGGKREELKIQYTSMLMNNFISSSLLVLQSHYAPVFDIQIKEVKLDNLERPDPAGYDLYIYEHYVPDVLPADGVILLLDPPHGTMPGNAGFSTGGMYDASSRFAPLTRETDHPLIRNIKADDITVSLYNRIVNQVGYDVLLSCDTYPMLMVKEDITDTKVERIMVMPFSVHYSNFGNSLYCPLFMNNVLNYFFPTMTDGNSFEIGESVQLAGRGKSLSVAGGNEKVWNFGSFPATLTFDLPGTYTVSQTTYYGKEINADLFVKIPAAESNVCALDDTMKNPVRSDYAEEQLDDLLVWFAAALFALLIADWLLQIRNDA